MEFTFLAGQECPDLSRQELAYSGLVCKRIHEEQNSSEDVNNEPDSSPLLHRNPTTMIPAWMS